MRHGRLHNDRRSPTDHRRAKALTSTDLRALAIRAVSAGTHALSETRRSAGWDQHRKASGEHIDLHVETAIRHVLTEATPDIPILGEETGGALADRSWVIDPVDGTVNLLRGLPHFGISVGLLVDGIARAGAIGAPALDELWSAERGGGAHDRHGNRIEVRGLSGAASTVSTGPPPPDSPGFAPWLALVDVILRDGRDIRRCGSAAIDLAYAASGVVDGHVELGGLTAESSAQEALGLGPWDVAAGALLIVEAGGRATDWRGDEAGLFRSGDICAGAPEWHEWMLDVIRTVTAAPNP